MYLHEYQTKQLFAKYGIPIPTGYTCTTPNEAEKAASKIGEGPWVVKCQIHAGGRGIAGGVKLINSKENIRAFAEAKLGQRLVTDQTNAQGQLVHHILVEATTEIDTELYLGAIVDRNTSRLVFMASTKGGIKVEKITKEYPTLIHKITIDPLVGAQPYQGRVLAFKLGLSGKQINYFANIVIKLTKLFLEHDLVMLEVNPLAITKQGELVCLDGKLNADSNALFRQPALLKMRDLSQKGERESRAIQANLHYVTLNGNIGLMVNGAGLAMATMDVIKLYGGEPANFLDIGGNITNERIAEALRIILSDNKVKAVLVNIFGGIVCCNLIADAIISVMTEVDNHIPVIVRLEGNNAKLGIKKLIYSNLNIIATTSLINVMQQIIKAVRDK